MGTVKLKREDRGGLVYLIYVDQPSCYVCAKSLAGAIRVLKVRESRPYVIV